MKSVEELKTYFDEYLSQFRDLDIYCWIAGGSIRDFFLNEERNDIDLFLKTSSDQLKAKNLLIGNGFTILKKHPNHYTLGRGANELYGLMIAENNPQECIDNFDYTVCSAALDSELNFFHHVDFFEHLKEKKLIRSEQSDRWVITNVRRLRKFLKRGYSIDKKNLIQYLYDQEATFEYRKRLRELNDN
jgi:hypothetical protein